MEKEFKMIDVESIVPNVTQPRTTFNDESIDELSVSILENGLIQPIIVRPIECGQYEIVAGERRFRACKRALIKEIPCIIQEYDDMHLAQAALIENIQRENLTPIEEAKAYKYLIDTHHLTQKQISQQVGKKQSTIANKLRLLNLPMEIQDSLLDRKITERHARALLGIEDVNVQLKALKKIEEKGLTVKQTEDLVANDVVKKRKPKGTVRGFSKNIKIAINTINQAIDMIRKTGITIDSTESESDEYYTINIKIKK